MSSNLPALVLSLVMLSWVAFVLVFFVRKRPPSSPDSKREGKSMVGIVLQAAAYATVFGVTRALVGPIIPMRKPLEIALAACTVVVAFGSVWLFAWSFRTLGKQWSVRARLIEDHDLITGGPYHFVRHPIYTAMLGMLLATGLAKTHWIALTIAIALYAVGTVIRIRSEEKLLREAFGKRFEEYARTVPAVVPFLI